ncbi:MAG: carboxypeptidase-like regulatory domain-containing protein, partial [Bacteroidales bacterium]|nr:carboxypeptidase-like regulatory domain-containing protein [Bacteroidales bacterium]
MKESNYYSNRIRKLLFLFFGLLIIPIIKVEAQKGKTVNGIVRDVTGAPIVGATVMIKGTTIGTLTNQEGRFSLSIPDSKGATLVVSFLGMEKQEIDVSEVSTIDVV